MVDAFILGATWQLLSDPVKRRTLFQKLLRQKTDEKLDHVAEKLTAP